MYKDDNSFITAQLWRPGHCHLLAGRPNGTHITAIKGHKKGANTCTTKSWMCSFPTKRRCKATKREGNDKGCPMSLKSMCKDPGGTSAPLSPRHRIYSLIIYKMLIRELSVVFCCCQVQSLRRRLHWKNFHCQKLDFMVVEISNILWERNITDITNHHKIPLRIGKTSQE